MAVVAAVSFSWGCKTGEWARALRRSGLQFSGGAVRTLGNRVAILDTRRVKPPPKIADQFYLSREWRALMDQIINDRGRTCQDPDCPKPHPPISRVFGDHIKELKDGGATLDPANVLLRCGAAHTRKT